MYKGFIIIIIIIIMVYITHTVHPEHVEMYSSSSECVYWETNAIHISYTVTL